MVVVGARRCKVTCYVVLTAAGDGPRSVKPPPGGISHHLPSVIPGGRMGFPYQKTVYIDCGCAVSWNWQDGTREARSLSHLDCLKLLHKHTGLRGTSAASQHTCLLSGAAKYVFGFVPIGGLTITGIKRASISASAHNSVVGSGSRGRDSRRVQHLCAPFLMRPVYDYDNWTGLSSYISGCLRSAKSAPAPIPLYDVLRRCLGLSPPLGFFPSLYQ
jgi:hypothetical protein